MNGDGDLWVLPDHALNGELEYPEHRECDWLLECDISEDEIERIAVLLAEHVSHPAVLLHRPRWIREYEKE